MLQDEGAIYLLVTGNVPNDAVQRADSKRFVGRNGDPVRGRGRRLQNDVTANLMDLGVIPVTAEMVGKFHSAEVAGKLHAMASTSSRTSRRRIAAGLGLSKK